MKNNKNNLDALGPMGELYVPEAHLNRVVVIDTTTSTITRHIPLDDIPILPLGSRPSVLIATPDGSKIYSDNFGLIPPTVSVINRVENTVRSILVSHVPLGIFISNDGEEIYVSEGNYTVEVINTRTDEIVRSLTFHDVPVACMSGPGNHLYIGFGTGYLGVYDKLTGEVIKEPLYVGGTLPAWFTFTHDNKKLYVDAVNTIGVIDVDQWKLLKTIPTSGELSHKTDDPWAFTSILSPDGKKLYVSLLGDSGILVLDVDTDQISKTIETAGSATGITFSGDGKRGYISDMGASLSFLKTPIGGAILGTAWVGFGITGNGQIITFDPSTDEIIGTPLTVGPTPGIPVWVPSIQ